MAANSKSIAEELLEAISYQQMRAHPAYISESDAVTYRDFAQMELSSRYVLDTINLYWPGRTNPNHVFEIFSEYFSHGDSGKTRLDMINFVADNKQRYKMDCHIVLKMHETNLEGWACRMTYFENCADELALYALSDLTKKHTVVITMSKPWTTLHPDVNISNIYDLIDKCDVKLVFLGNCHFGRLRVRPPGYANPIITSTPVFPQPQPSEREMETAESLLLMNRQAKLSTPHQQKSDLKLLQPETITTTTAEMNLPPELRLDIPVVDNTVDLPNYSDAMEYILDTELVSTRCCSVLETDAMDTICSFPSVVGMDSEPVKFFGFDGVPLLVETPTTDAMTQITGYTEPGRQYGQPAQDCMSLLVETTCSREILVRPEDLELIVPCMVTLKRIDSVLSFVPEQDVCKAIMQAGRPHTRSQSRPKPKPVRKTRRPRAAHNKTNYADRDTTSEDEPARKKAKSVPQSSGPSSSRILAQNNKTVHPTQRFRILSDTPVTSSTDDDKDDISDAPTELYDPDSVENEEAKLKGTFQITTKTLKKQKRYPCKQCDAVCNSSRELTIHHHRKHNLMHCTDCNKGFNNPTTFHRHVKSHSSGCVCKICGKRFAYQSQLTTHEVVHGETRHKCKITNCGKSFKNIGDLTRHIKSHTAETHKCTDCDYEHVDIRNFESHRQKHSRITKYVCSLCNKAFIYNSQLQRHLVKQECTLKRSNSPEY